MSRSGYHDDCDDNWVFIRWRGAVASAFRGARGRAFLKEAAAALDAMSLKELAAESLVTGEGAFCLLGAVGQARGMDMSGIDPDDSQSVARAFGIANAMACEIVFMNDEGSWRPEAMAERWQRMRRWVDDCLGVKVK